MEPLLGHTLRNSPSNTGIAGFPLQHLQTLVLVHSLQKHCSDLEPISSHQGGSELGENGTLAFDNLIFT